MVDELYSDPRLAALYERMYPRSAAADEFYLALMMASSSSRAALCVVRGTEIAH